ncbi:MAG: hypothetical protein ACLPXB_04330 [Thiobacillaceae bacterium]
MLEPLGLIVRSAKIILLACLAATLSACATPATDDGQLKGLSVSGLGEGGCLVGSIGEDTARSFVGSFGWVFLIYGPVGNDNVTQQIKFGHNGVVDTPLDFTEKDLAAATFRICLQPGKYEIRNVRFYYNNGMVEKTFSAREPFSIPLDVVRGEVHYVGRYIAHTVKGKNIFGLPILAGGYFTVEDATQNDWPVIRKKYPALPDSPLAFIPASASLPKPFIVERQ